MYELRVIYGMPRASDCSQFNGYEIRRMRPTGWRSQSRTIRYPDPDVVCPAGYPVVETIVPWALTSRPAPEGLQMQLGMVCILNRDDLH